MIFDLPYNCLHGHGPIKSSAKVYLLLDEKEEEYEKGIWSKRSRGTTTAYFQQQSLPKENSPSPGCCRGAHLLFVQTCQFMSTSEASIGSQESWPSSLFSPLEKGWTADQSQAAKTPRPPQPGPARLLSRNHLGTCEWCTNEQFGAAQIEAKMQWPLVPSPTPCTLLFQLTISHKTKESLTYEEHPVSSHNEQIFQNWQPKVGFSCKYRNVRRQTHSSARDCATCRSYLLVDIIWHKLSIDLHLLAPTHLQVRKAFLAPHLQRKMVALCPI